MEHIEFINFFRHSTSNELANELKNVKFKLIVNINNYKEYAATYNKHRLGILIFPNNAASISLVNLPFARCIDILDFKENLIDEEVIQWVNQN